MKAVVLHSGGIDSTTCLAMAVDKYGADSVTALSLYYGQKHSKELECSREISTYYGVRHIEFDVQKIFDFSSCSLLKGSTNDIPQKSYAEQIKENCGEPVSTYVPFRNGLFLSIAASMAISLDVDVVYYGAHADDAAGNAYPDCSIPFNEAMKTAIYLGSGKKITVFAPFIDKTKAQVVATGLHLEAPYKLTWSCYEGNEKPCGRCATCIDRKRAFEINGVKDPLEY